MFFLAIRRGQMRLVRWLLAWGIDLSNQTVRSMFMEQALASESQDMIDLIHQHLEAQAAQAAQAAVVVATTAQ